MNYCLLPPCSKEVTVTNWRVQYTIYLPIRKYKSTITKLSIPFIFSLLLSLLFIPLDLHSIFVNKNQDTFTRIRATALQGYIIISTKFTHDFHQLTNSFIYTCIYLLFCLNSG